MFLPVLFKHCFLKEKNQIAVLKPVLRQCNLNHTFKIKHFIAAALQLTAGVKNFYVVNPHEQALIAILCRPSYRCNSSLKSCGRPIE